MKAHRISRNFINTEKHGTRFRVILLFSVLFCVLLCLSVAPAPAQAAISSSDYKIQMPNLNFSSGAMSSAEYKLGFTGGQTASGPYSSVGYRVYAGFWYLKTIIPFGFSVSPTTVDFSPLTAGNPVTKAITLTVSAGGAGGYQVTAQENKPLTAGSGTTIADTICDDGYCTEDDATAWSQDNTYGFGYTMYGTDVPTPFPTGAPAGNQYKQFANILLNEIAEPVMTYGHVGKSRSATMTMKINISGTQAAGVYQNILTFIATPTY